MIWSRATIATKKVDSFLSCSRLTPPLSERRTGAPAVRLSAASYVLANGARLNAFQPPL